MMRDDSTGGWVPVGGGGLSNVSVQKQKIFHEDEDQLCKHEYLIDGKRISDQAVSWIIQLHTHSSEKRGLCLMKCSSEILQNLPYFWNTKTNAFFSFCAT